MNRFEKVNAMNMIKGLKGNRLSIRHEKKDSSATFREPKEHPYKMARPESSTYTSKKTLKNLGSEMNASPITG